MSFRFLKYTAVLIIPALTLFSFLGEGWWSFSTVIFTYLIVPAAEFLFPKDESNLDQDRSTRLSKTPVYDYLLYIMVPIQYGLLISFFLTLSADSLSTIEFLGKSMSMGVSCGVLGINVAHELGHRKGGLERFLAKSLLLTSLYMHFIIEHNRGHHKYVSTPRDPASARKGEWVQFFWFRSMIMSYLSAWKLEADRLRKSGLSIISFKNEMLRFQVFQTLLLIMIFWVFGAWVLVGFLIAAGVGIIQLETVNYIEHYALQRKETGENRYERVQPWHSWNSNHLVGRMMLFELSRHSDHHYLASKKYQLLDHHDGSPQMPTGYPGMMLLSLLPPLWFSVMHKRLNAIQEY